MPGQHRAQRLTSPELRSAANQRHHTRIPLRGSRLATTRGRAGLPSVAPHGLSRQDIPRLPPAAGRRVAAQTNGPLTVSWTVSLKPTDNKGVYVVDVDIPFDANRTQVVENAIDQTTADVHRDHGEQVGLRLVGAVWNPTPQDLDRNAPRARQLAAILAKANNGRYSLDLTPAEVVWTEADGYTIDGMDAYEWLDAVFMD